MATSPMLTPLKNSVIKRGLQRHANRAHGDGVLGVRYRGDLVGAVFDRAERAQFRRVVQ